MGDTRRKCLKCAVSWPSGAAYRGRLMIWWREAAASLFAGNCGFKWRTKRTSKAGQVSL